MENTETLKAMLTSVAGFTEKLNKLKESLASLASDENQGGNVDNLTDEQKAEAAKIEEAKAAELATAEAKKKADEEAAKKVKDDKDADDSKARNVVDSENDKLNSKTRSEVKASEDDKVAGGVEKIKREVEDALAAKAKLDADEMAKQLQAKAALELAEAEAAKKAKDEKLDRFKKSMSSEEVKDLGLEGTEADLASKHSFVDLVKVLASLSKEVAALKEVNAKAEASKLADSRYKELVDLGVAFVGKKEESQKASLSSMDEKAFASYKEMALTMKGAIDSGEGLTKEAVEKAKASIGKLGLEVKLTSESLADKYKKLK